MPLYEYKCKDCSNIISEVQSIHDEPLKVCPDCNGELKKLISLSSPDVNYKNGQEYYEKVIKPDAKRIVNEIKNGNENLAANIFGEGD